MNASSIRLSLKVFADPYVVQVMDKFAEIYASEQPNSPITQDPEDARWLFISEVCEHVASLDTSVAPQPGTLFWKRWWRDQAEIFAPTRKETEHFGVIGRFTTLIYIDSLKAHDMLQELKRTVFIVAGLIKIDTSPGTYFG